MNSEIKDLYIQLRSRNIPAIEAMSIARERIAFHAILDASVEKAMHEFVLRLAIEQLS